jgi:hypothetical protein
LFYSSLEIYKISYSTSERLKKDWNAAIYAFFEPTPEIVYIKERRVHVFRCLAKSCKGKGRPHARLVNRFLDTKDAKSTSNLLKHARVCWGRETVEAANITNLDGAREAVGKNELKDGSLTAVFERLKNGKGKLTYSHRQHTKTEAKYVHSNILQINPIILNFLF